MDPRILRKYAWLSILTLALLLATTTLAAAQTPDLLLPLVTEAGQPEQVQPEIPEDEVAPEILLPSEPDPEAPVGDSRDTDSGDYDVDLPAEMAAVDAFSASQWTVQNKLGVGTQSPTEDVDISRNANVTTRLLVRNPHTGNSVQASLFLNTGTSNGLVVQQFGQGYVGSWSGVSLTNAARLRTTPTAKNLIVATGGNYPLILGTADVERMRITKAGLVGIGTSTPAHQLSIAGGPPWTTSGWGGAVELINGSAIGWRTNGAGYSFGMGHSNDGFYFFRTGSPPGSISTGATYDLVIGDNGYVGIGTAFPQYELHVNGSTYVASNLVVDGSLYVDGQQMDVPDYVFEPDYPLLSLNELRAYIAEESHLPNVPSEEEIRAGNLDLGGFQMRLLEKTEELTLYTLAQDEQITSLQQENQVLQETNQIQAEQLELLQQMIADLETRLAALEEQK